MFDKVKNLLMEELRIEEDKITLEAELAKEEEVVEETVVDPYIDEWVLMKALDPWNTHISPQMKPNALIYSYFYVIII